MLCFFQLGECGPVFGGLVLVSQLMAQTNSDFRDYASQLFQASDFDQAFEILQKEVLKFGFDGVLYTYIPRVLLDAKFHVNPVYQVSPEYNPGYMAHYTEARFERVDPLVQAVQDGVDKPISWWGNVCQQYMDADTASKEVICTAKDYGIHNGITVPLLSGESGIAGASFISEERNSFGRLVDEQIESLMLYTRLFHNLVLSNAPYRNEFIKPLLESLNETELRFLTGLANGQTPAQIAFELGRTEGYLEQVMIKLRRKLSGVGAHDSPMINRNQLLYYAGLLEVANYQN